MLPVFSNIVMKMTNLESKDDLLIVLKLRVLLLQLLPQIHYFILQGIFSCLPPTQQYTNILMTIRTSDPTLWLRSTHHSMTYVKTLYTLHNANVVG